MEEMTKHHHLGHAAMMAGMDRKTAAKYIEAGALPSQMRHERDWRTRPDPFAEHWPLIEGWLRDQPALEAKTVFELLRKQFPGLYEPGQLRTLQRRVRTWRAECGPDKDIKLAQCHRPGEAAQTDFTSTNELQITIAGQLFVHLLCVFVLPFSNWRWATVCLSESLAAIRRGVQRALFQLGRVPRFHQTDNSTAATHRIAADKKTASDNSPRKFNEEYLALMRHFAMTPRTTEIGAKEQNGDVEASNGVLKRALEQALLVRGHREFDSPEAWQSFVDQVVRKSNEGCGQRLLIEMAAMRELNVSKLPEYTEEKVRVSEWSTIRIKHCAYSVPSRLQGEMVRVRIYEDKIEVSYAGKPQLVCERLRGQGRQQRHRIDYRHVIGSLVRKPGGFARYVYREEMFPTVIFRRAYDVMQAKAPGTKGDLEYLRVLYLAATHLQDEVEAILSSRLAANEEITADLVGSLLTAARPVEVPQIALPVVDLRAYDALLEEVSP